MMTMTELFLCSLSDLLLETLAQDIIGCSLYNFSDITCIGILKFGLHRYRFDLMIEISVSHLHVGNCVGQ